MVCSMALCCWSSLVTSWLHWRRNSGPELKAAGPEVSWPADSFYFTLFSSAIGRPVSSSYSLSSLWFTGLKYSWILDCLHTQSNIDLKVFRLGASTISLGNIFQEFTAQTVRNIYLLFLICSLFLSLDLCPFVWNIFLTFFNVADINWVHIVDVFIKLNHTST